MKKKILGFFILFLFLISYTASASENSNNKDTLQYLARPNIVNSTLSDREFTKFENIIDKALDLLQEYDPDAYIRVCLNIKQIGHQQDTPDALAIANMENVCLTESLHKDSIKYVPWFVAGILSHESLHTSMYKYSQTSILGDLYRTAHINQEEILAHQCAINTFKKLNAPDWAINEHRITQQQFKDKLTN